MDYVFTFDGSEYLKVQLMNQVSSGNHWCIGLFRYNGTDNTKDSFWSYETNQSPKRDDNKSVTTHGLVK